MTYKVLLLRLGRIYKPKYDIILYHNWKPIVKLGTMHPLKEFAFEGQKVKTLSLNINIITFWLKRGIIFPKWLLEKYKVLYSAHRFYSGKVYSSISFHTALIRGDTIYNNLTQKHSKHTNYNSPRFHFFRGKYLVRNWIRHLKKPKQ
jgi:ribosomal protein S16